ncbi:MAG: lamin tail domain-containing protein [Candidatus Bipolaricaulota bacterium]|nr:lamin tail domain-containing protein [Candidatus Bipolaricaulota bacterium]MBS3792467.1 lamin tail domain-containing protein [Candidatus Bipolaricaulota bacterium]
MRFSILRRLLVLGLLVGLIGVVGLASTDSAVTMSEVAWSGTPASWADEWVELRNLTDEAIDLTGWTLSWDGVTIDLGKERENTLTVADETIEPGEAFLLERSDDDAVSSVEADIIYKGSLSNSGEKMVLENSGGDKVHVVDGSEGWMAGTSSSGDPGYASMELIDGEWKTHQEKGDQSDMEGNRIYGSPGLSPESTE